METMHDGAAREAGHATPRPFQLFMLVICLYSLGMLLVEAVVPLSPATRELLEYADTGVCILFLADFVVQMVKAPDRWAYFRRWGWIDLLSSIPMVDALRFGRAARVMRILRVLRGLRSTRLIAQVILTRRSEGAFLAMALLSLLLVLFSSIAILEFENVDGANIRGAQDALWWSFVTITTVGYGDRYPITWEGRIIAAGLITAGVGLFGAISGFVASWLLADQRQQQAAPAAHDDELRLLRVELAEVRALLTGTTVVRAEGFNDRVSTQPRA